MTQDAPGFLSRELARKTAEFVRAQGNGSGNVGISQREGSPAPSLATATEIIQQGTYGSVVIEGSGLVVKAYARWSGYNTGEKFIIAWTSGNEISTQDEDDPVRRGQWEILGPPINLTSFPPSSSGCGCSDYVEGTVQHDCEECGCINKFRWIYPPVLQTLDDEDWLESGVPRKVTHDTGCVWYSLAFSGKACMVDDVDVANLYRWRVPKSGNVTLDLVEDNGCPIVQVEYCRTNTCGDDDSNCLGPWTYGRGKFDNIRAPGYCQVCVTPKLKTLSRRYGCGDNFVDLPDILIPEILRLTFSLDGDPSTVPDAEYDLSGSEWDASYDGDVCEKLICPTFSDGLQLTAQVQIYSFIPQDPTTVGDVGVHCSILPLESGEDPQPNLRVFVCHPNGGAWAIYYATRDIIPDDWLDTPITFSLDAETCPIEGTCPSSLTIEFQQNRARSSGHIGSACGGEPNCDGATCVLVVEEVSADFGKKWVASPSSTCEPNCGNCFADGCNDVTDGFCGDANDFDEGHECEKPCEAEPEPENDTVEVTFDYSGSGACVCGETIKNLCLNTETGHYVGLVHLCGSAFIFDYYEDGGTWHLDGGPINATSSDPAGPFEVAGTSDLPGCDGLNNVTVAP